jgi:hypothetical protein
MLNNMLNNMQWQNLLWISALLAVAVAPLEATTLARMSLDDLTHSAGAVARLRCVARESHWDSGEIWTFTRFAVIESWKGSLPTHITVRLLGGRVGDLTSIVPGVPRFAPGDDVVLFLQTTRAGDFSVAAWAEGTFRVHIDRVGQQLVTQQTAAYSAHVSGLHEGSTRKIAALEGIRNLPIEELRRRVIAAAGMDAGRGARK